MDSFHGVLALFQFFPICHIVSSSSSSDKSSAIVFVLFGSRGHHGKRQPSKLLPCKRPEDFPCFVPNHKQRWPIVTHDAVGQAVEGQTISRRAVGKTPVILSVMQRNFCKTEILDSLASSCDLTTHTPPVCNTVLPASRQMRVTRPKCRPGAADSTQQRLSVALSSGAGTPPTSRKGKEQHGTRKMVKTHEEG